VQPRRSLPNEEVHHDGGETPKPFAAGRGWESQFSFKARVSSVAKEIAGFRRGKKEKKGKPGNAKNSFLEEGRKEDIDFFKSATHTQIGKDTD